MSDILLKPCPLCLCEEFELEENSDLQATAVYCTNCAYGVEDSSKSLEELIELHNSRPYEEDRFRDTIYSLFGKLSHGIIASIDKYRSEPLVNMDYDRARVVLDLEFPRDLRLYHLLKRMKNPYDSIYY
jgi:hypothetical protein